MSARPALAGEHCAGPNAHYVLSPAARAGPTGPKVLLPRRDDLTVGPDRPRGRRERLPLSIARTRAHARRLLAGYPHPPRDDRFGGAWSRQIRALDSATTSSRSYARAHEGHDRTGYPRAMIMAMGPRLGAPAFVVTGSRGSPRPVRHDRAMGTEPTTGLEPSVLLVKRVEETLAERTTAWSRVTRSGYSSVERWIVRLSDNETVFVKSSGEPLLASFLRDEHHIYANLRGSFLPRLVAWSDGDQPVLVLEALTDAHWPPPWTETSIEKALSTLDEIALHPFPTGYRSPPTSTSSPAAGRRSSQTGLRS